MALGDFLSLGGTLFNSVLGSSSNANLNKKNRQFQQHLADQAYQRQRELTVDSASLQKQGLLQAGISPAAMNGYSGGTASISSGPSAPSQQSEYVPFDISSALQGILASSNIQNTKANTRKTNADAKAQELENEKTQSEMNEWRNRTAQHDAYFIDDNGVQHSKTDSDFDEQVQKYRDSHNGTYPDTIVTPSNVISERQALVKKTLSDIDASIARNDNDVVQSKFAKQVAMAKLADSDVMHAIYNMDLKQFESLTETINKVKSDIDVNKSVSAYNKAKTAESKQSVLESIARTALIKSQDKALSNSNIANMIDSLFNAKDTKTGLVILGKILLSIFVGNGSSGLASALISKK